MGSIYVAWWNVENLFDEEYETAAGYNSTERAFHLRLGYTLRP